jgi:hypothetical protein
MVDTLNKELSGLGLKFARLKSKASGSWETYYGVVNLVVDDTFSKLADPLGKAEQEFFRRCVQPLGQAPRVHGEHRPREPRARMPSTRPCIWRDCSQARLLSSAPGLHSDRRD